MIAVWTDNSNDPTYPPGKPQDMLDFCYFGGIYRDCWLVAHGAVYITDPNYEKVTAGGGLFVAYDRVSDAQADICLQLHLRNDGRQTFNGVVEYELLQPDGKQAALINTTVRVKAGNAQTVKDKLTLKQPLLWSPEEPTLYNLVVRIRDKKGNVVDGYRRRMGIRSIEFKGADGFWLNGKPYEAPLIGANRHQDYALVGNAVPNALHWRDAEKTARCGAEGDSKRALSAGSGFHGCLRRIGAVRYCEYTGLAVLERGAGVCRTRLQRHTADGAPRPQSPVCVAVGTDFERNVVSG